MVFVLKLGYPHCFWQYFVALLVSPVEYSSFCVVEGTDMIQLPHA
jgi:hypothetical protein